MTPDDLHTLTELRQRRAMQRKGLTPQSKRLHDLELSEVSVVNVPANAGAAHLFHKGLHHIEKSEALPLSPQGAVALMGELLTEQLTAIAAGIAKVEATAERVIAGGGGGAPAAPVVAEALRAARAAEDHPPEFWRAALRHLGEIQAPDASPLQQQHEALAHPDGHVLVRALTGGR
jgi:porphobilinogen deaminase